MNENIPFIMYEANNTYARIDMSDNSKIRVNSNVTREKINVMDFGKNDSKYLFG
jgi:hypothetical protein